MTTSKINPNATSMSKLEEVPITTANLNPYHHDAQQRISPSKRTTTKMINNFDQSVDHPTTTVHQSRIHHSTRSIKPKDKCDMKITNVSKPESESEEVYTAPSNLSPSICHKQHLRQGIGDYIRKDNIDDVDEESVALHAIINKNKTPIEHVHRSNNSASRLQQQGMGDHYHTSSKQHKSRTTSALNRKYHRLIEQQDVDMTLNERNAYRWRLTMYIIIILVLSFVIYRFLLAVWPKPKKTFIEQLIDNLSTFFTP